MKIFLFVTVLFLGIHLYGQNNLLVKIEYYETINVNDRESKRFQYDSRIESVYWSLNKPKKGKYYIQQIVEEMKYGESKVKILSNKDMELDYDFTIMSVEVKELIKYINQIKKHSKNYNVESLWLELDSTNNYICNRTIKEIASNTFIDSVSIRHFGYNLTEFESDLNHYIKSRNFVNYIEPNEILSIYNRDSIESNIKNHLLLSCSYGIKSYSNSNSVLTISWKSKEDSKWNSLIKSISSSNNPVWELIDAKTEKKYRIISPKLDYLSIHSVPFNFRRRILINQFHKNKEKVLNIIVEELERKIVIQNLKKN